MQSLQRGAGEVATEFTEEEFGCEAWLHFWVLIRRL